MVLGVGSGLIQAEATLAQATRRNATDGPLRVVPYFADSRLIWAALALFSLLPLRY